MRRFVDLQVRWPGSLEEAGLLASHLRKLGFKTVALTVSRLEEAEGRQTVRGVFEEKGVEALSRLNLKPETSRQLLEALRAYRRSFEIVSVVCLSKQVARQAAKDHRVDTLLFPGRAVRLLDEAEVELARSSGVAFEFSLSMLLKLEGKLPGYLAEAGRNVRRALKKGVPLVFSSGASDVYGLRAPRDLAATVEIMLGLPPGFGLLTVSRFPLEIVERNKVKLSRTFIEPGVRLVLG